MALLAWVFLGIFLGTVGHLLDAREAKGGLIGAMLFGIAGSVTGGFLAAILFYPSKSGIDLLSMLVVFSGGIFLLLIQRTLFTLGERF